VRRLILGLVTLAVLVPNAPVAADTPPPSARLASPEIFGYLPYWDLNGQLDFGAITTIAYFGLGATADGHLDRYAAGGGLQTEYSRWKGSRVSAVISQAHAAGDKFVLTVERMAWSDSGAAATRTLLSNPAARQSLAADIVNEISSRGVDGVSLDFEPILSDQRDNFAAFLGELRAALDAVNPGYQLTFAATGSQPAKTYDMFGAVTAAGQADAVIIMGYPLRGIDAKRAGGLAPVSSPYAYSLKQIVSAYLADVTPDKVILALPWYGRDWPTQTDDLNASVQPDTSSYDRARNIGYVNSLNLAIANGRRYDPVEQSAWTAYRTRYCLDCPETWSQAYYEDVDSLAFKYNWAVNTKGLRGIGIFALGYDDAQPEMWKLLRVAFRGLVDTDPPTGSFGPPASENMCTAPRVRLGFQLADGANGSGAVYVRLSNQATTDASGLLSAGRTYPAAAEIPWQLDDPATGGSNSTGARTVYGQWRDVSGNWSPVSSVAFEVNSFVATASLSLAGGADFVSDPTIAVKVARTGGGRTLAKARLSSNPSVGSDGLLTYGQNYDANQNGNVKESFSLIDRATGGADVDGRHSVWAQWRDSAGCWSAPVYGRVTLDRGGPVGSLSVVGAPASSFTGDVQVLAPATDAGSGVAELALSNDGLNWQSLTPTNDPIAWNAGATPDGPWTIRARWRDGAGSWSDVASTSLTLDRHGPAGTLLLDGGAPTTGGPTVTVTAPATDASGVTGFILANSSATVDGVLSTGTSFAPDTVVDWALAGADTEAGVTEGPSTVYAQWRDGVGHWSDVVSATIMVDRGAPTVSAPQPGLTRGTQLGASVPVIGTWSATDPLSGIATQQVQLAPEGATWRPAAAINGQPPQAGQIDLSSAWQFMVSATDGAGNASQPVASEPFAAQLVQDNSASVTYTRVWKVAQNSSSSGGTTRYSTTRGATATLTFTGRAVAWVAPVASKRGKAKVFIDGALVTTVNLRSTARQRVLVFSRNWDQVGQHTIRIKVLATYTRPRIDLDGFVILN
jgi:spore germination protein YaaH